MPPNVTIDPDAVARFCRRWGVAEFALFGSVLRDDFRPESDVDVLLTFQPGTGFTFDNRVEMLDELQSIFGRDVDCVDRDAIRNPFRRHTILRTRKILYAA